MIALLISWHIAVQLLGTLPTSTSTATQQHIMKLARDITPQHRGQFTIIKIIFVLKLLTQEEERKKAASRKNDTTLLCFLMWVFEGYTENSSRLFIYDSIQRWVPFRLYSKGQNDIHIKENNTLMRQLYLRLDHPILGKMFNVGTNAQATQILLANQNWVHHPKKNGSESL